MHNEPSRAASDTSAWLGSRSYADHVAIRIRAVSSAADDEVPIEEWRVSSPGAAWPPDWLIEQAESIVLAAKPLDRNNPPDYYIDVNERRMNWGADVSVFEILIGMASWAATSAAWDATKALASQMSERIRGGAAPALDEIPSESEAVAAAIDLAVGAYPENGDGLLVESVTLEAGRANVTLRSHDGWMYDYELHIRGGNVRATRIRRYRSE